MHGLGNFVLDKFLNRHFHPHSSESGLTGAPRQQGGVRIAEFLSFATCRCQSRSAIPASSTSKNTLCGPTGQLRLPSKKEET